MTEQDKIIPHEGFVKEVVRKVLQQEAIPYEVLDFSPMGSPWVGGIYSNPDATSGALTVRAHGPNSETYDVVLQAGDILDPSAITAAFDSALPDTALFYFWSSNASDPGDGQISAFATNSWYNKANVFIEAISSTLDVGELDNDIGAYTTFNGADDYDAEDGTLVNFNGTLFIRASGGWSILGPDFVSQLGITIRAGKDSPDEQFITMNPPGHSIGFDVANEIEGVSASFYIFAPDAGGANLQFHSNSPDVGSGRIQFAAGQIDPSAGSGLDVAFGTLYARNIDGDSAELWFHQGPLDTDWTRIVPPAV